MPLEDREEQFKRCALYNLHRDFFEENFAKYPVIVMDFKTAEISELCRFCSHLSLSFLQQNGYQRQVGIAADLMRSDHIDDAAIEIISSQMQSQSPFGDSTETSRTRAGLADICMSRVGDAFGDMLSMGSGPLKAGTIIRLLYQSGYIAPVTRDCVGIPNQAALDALEKLYKQIAKRHEISSSFLDSTHEEMGGLL
ncbi:hypothetical protein EV177_005610 [Coemansia sp. RSA 1804]|nr:hypothetical protein EV177_005610 [Coemansia sp. RSA 1804]